MLFDQLSKAFTGGLCAFTHANRPLLKTSKNIGNHCVSARPLKWRILLFPSKSYLFSENLINPCQNERFYSKIPAHGHAAAERSTARTFRSHTACRMRHMEIIENTWENVVFSVCSKAQLCEHNSVLWTPVSLGWLQECTQFS